MGCTEQSFIADGPLASASEEDLEDTEREVETVEYCEEALCLYFLEHQGHAVKQQSDYEHR